MNTPAMLLLLGGVLIPSSTAPIAQSIPATPTLQTAPDLGSAEIYCPAEPNSMGIAATIGTFGSLAPTNETFGLSVTGVPAVPTSWGMFTCGTEQTNIPFGNGRLCVSPFSQGIFRMTTQSLAQGTITLSMETSLQDFVLCTPGSTWNFQFWYRDVAAGGSRFNLSNAVHVRFAP
ncbi:MAG: hypothetical protein IPJ77_05475 [Planctomycetes bacterium]|nr:hypothetical protein [Planctomycetota bacterium]